MDAAVTNGSKPGDEQAPVLAEPVMLAPDLVDGILRQAVDAGFASIPPEIATEIGQQAVLKVMANRQADFLMKENADLRKKIEVMETDIAVLHARLQEAGLEPIETEGAEVTPPEPFPSGEPSAAESAEDQADAS